MVDSEKDPYELLDFGEGRKLERFGGIVLNRPSLAAEGGKKSQPELWNDATARFRGPRTGDGSWSPSPKQWQPDDWRFGHDSAATFSLKLDALPSGQIGVFPEQRDNWDWIVRQVTRLRSHLGDERSPRVLNLFAYTGGSTLAAAAAGAEVVHIDAAQNIVDRAGKTPNSPRLPTGPFAGLPKTPSNSAAASSNAAINTMP